MIASFMVIVALVPAALDLIHKPEPPRDYEKVLGALARITIPIRSVDAGSGFDDLSPLGNILGQRRIVALGEATHGTSEFFG